MFLKSYKEFEKSKLLFQAREEKYFLIFLLNDIYINLTPKFMTRLELWKAMIIAYKLKYCCVNLTQQLKLQCY